MVTTVIVPNAMSALSEGSNQFAYIAIATLIAVLFLRELASTGAAREQRETQSRFLAQALNGSIVALLTVFLVILVVRVWGVL